MGNFSSKPKSAGTYREALIAVKRLPELVDKFDGLHGNIQHLKRAVPTLITTGRFAGKLGAFYALVGTAGVVLQYVQVQQTAELIGEVRRIAVAQEALVALTVPTAFAKHAHQKVQYEIDTMTQQANGEENIYFDFNPDNKWHPDFHKLNKQAPLGDQFCGFSDDLPALCLWMRFIRILLSDLKNRKPGEYSDKKEVFHLIIPTYSSVLHDSPIKFSDDLLPLVIHGEVLLGKHLVQLNIPDADSVMLDRVENLYSEPGFFQTLFGPPPRPIVLGEIPKSADRAARANMNWGRNSRSSRRRGSRS